MPADVLGQAPSAETLGKWFETLSTLQRSASGSQDFFAAAATAVCDPGGLDAGFVIGATEVGVSDGLMKCRAPRWRINASHIVDTVTNIDLQPSILEEVFQEGRTLYHDAKACDELSEFVVASPIFDRDENVVGVVYGVRSTNGENKRRGVRPLEALWVQLVAEAATGAVVRGELESDLIRSRVLFETAFAPQIVDQLIENPTALTARERELTILFTDLRGFTRLSENLGPRATFCMLSEVMNRFTAQVMRYGGVVIDYHGDGMAAMWNAPADQPEHPLMACSAAFAIGEQLQILNHSWSDKLTSPLQIGIGLHSGTAMVGNAGSDRHLKYGPRGPAVNLTSRIETATKRLGVQIAISKDVQRRVDQHMVTRRLCQARLAGIDEPVEIFELVARREAHLDSCRVERLRRYEEALRWFEVGELDRAREILVNTEADNDRPSQLLLQAIDHSRRDESTFDAVLDLVSAAKS